MIFFLAEPNKENQKKNTLSGETEELISGHIKIEMSIRDSEHGNHLEL